MSKYPLTWVCGIVVCVLVVCPVGNQTPVTGLLDKTIHVDKDIYEALTSLLQDGVYQHDNVLIDISETQSVDVRDGAMIFSPPAKVNWRFISTTVTRMDVATDGSSIFVDIDHSPIDLNIKPE